MGDGENKLDRRQFLKMAPLSATAVGLAAAAAPGRALAEKAPAETLAARVTVHDAFPNDIRGDYQPPRSWDTVFGSAFFGRYLKAADRFVDEASLKRGDLFLKKVNYEFDNRDMAHNQLGKALVGGAWALSNRIAGPSPGAVSDYGTMSWAQPEDKPPYALMEHNFVQKEKYKFNTRQDAVAAIKRAARLYGADLVGIARRDKRWDYREFFNPVPPMGREMFPPPPSPESLPRIMKMMKAWGPSRFFHGWERFPFEPKTVIVMAFGMDYESISASPTEVSSAGVGEGYSQMAKTAYQLSVFFKQLGYNAVPCGNDTGMSIPYAIAAGLGEGARSGLLVTYNFGPRVRLAKVYTNFDFLEYDKPKTFGVMSFCRNCRRCADACPGKAISHDVEPTYEPTHEDKDNAYFNAKGILKYYVNCRKCFEFWSKNGSDCINCVTSCPYNKPDFWHHRAVRKFGKVGVDALHVFLREMDMVFGYGDTFDEKAIIRFFENRKDREYHGGL